MVSLGTTMVLHTLLIQTTFFTGLVERYWQPSCLTLSSTQSFSDEHRCNESERSSSHRKWKFTRFVTFIQILFTFIRERASVWNSCLFKIASCVVSEVKYVGICLLRKLLKVVDYLCKMFHQWCLIAA